MEHYKDIQELCMTPVVILPFFFDDGIQALWLCMTPLLTYAEFRDDLMSRWRFAYSIYYRKCQKSDCWNSQIWRTHSQMRTHVCCFLRKHSWFLNVTVFDPTEVRFQIGETSHLKKTGNFWKKTCSRSAGPVVRPPWRAASSGAKAHPIATRPLLA